MPPPALVLFGCGYSLTRLALSEAAGGRAVQAVTRDPERRARLSAGGVALVSLDEAVEAASEAHAVVSLPPEAGLDASLAPRLRGGPARLVYLSSTGVYGARRGDVDEQTAPDPSTPTARARLEAEGHWRGVGAVALRISGIYGPGRGTHARLLAGAVRLPESGGGRISRVHVDDLVQAIQVALASGEPGGVYCVADERPATQAETTAWLCERLGLPLPPTVPLGQLHESLRGDRAVSNARLKALGWSPRFPDYRVGFAAVLEAERGGP
jgi:nucleoside-diphosphate-sugar epimerase